MEKAMKKGKNYIKLFISAFSFGRRLLVGVGRFGNGLNYIYIFNAFILPSGVILSLKKFLQKLDFFV
jgi:hypothetical protein